MPYKPAEDFDDTHPFADSTERFPLDQHLRRHGFKIHSRRPKAEPVWERSGAVLLQGDAVLVAAGRAPG